MKLNEFIIPEDLRSAKSALKKLGEKGFAVAGGTSLVGATTSLDDLMNYEGQGRALD